MEHDTSNESAWETMLTRVDDGMDIPDIIDELSNAGVPDTEINRMLDELDELNRLEINRTTDELNRLKSIHADEHEIA